MPTIVPLYRQQGIYRRSGVELDRATLAARIGGAARLLEPLVDALGRYVRAAEKGTPTTHRCRCEAACWAHARRKFYELYVVDRSPIATEALQRIAALYAIERDIRGTLPAHRVRVRQEHTGPLLAALHVWLTTRPPTVSAKSELAGAIKYALVRWAGAHPLLRRRPHRDR